MNGVHICLIFLLHKGSYLGKICSREVAAQLGYSICIRCWFPCMVEAMFWSGHLFLTLDKTLHFKIIFI